MANLGKLFATLNQTYADSGIAHVSQIVRDLVLLVHTAPLGHDAILAGVAMAHKEISRIMNRMLLFQPKLIAMPPSKWITIWYNIHVC